MIAAMKWWEGGAVDIVDARHGTACAGARGGARCIRTATSILPTRLFARPMKPSAAPPTPSAAFSARFLRTAFDRRAPNWPQADFLMREVASRLASRLDYIKLKPTRVLDAGCGTGGAGLIYLA